MQSLDTSAITSVLIRAKRFEKKRDFDSVAEQLTLIWGNFSKPPDVSGLPIKLKAEFLMLCGHFLIAYGRAKGYSGYQEFAKDLLTKSIALFKVLKKSRKEAQASSHLALSYCYDGRARESLDVINEAEKLFPENSKDVIYLQLKTNQIIALSDLGRIKDCISIMELIAERIENSNNKNLSTKFYNQAGLVFSVSERHDLAVSMYSKAAKLCESIKDEHSLSYISNNLACALDKSGNSRRAVEHVCRAISLAEKFGDVGYLNNFEDTKANILLNLGDTTSAIQTINRTLKSLSMTGDVRTHCEAMWTKIEILLAIGDRPKAMLAFSDLGEFSKRELGETSAENYATKMLAKISSLKKDSESFPVEIVRFNPTNLKIINAPPQPFKMFLIPASHSAIIQQKGNIVVCTVEQRENPVIMKRQDSGKLFIGDLTTDNFMNFDVCVLKSALFDDEIFIPEIDFIEGHVHSVAKYNKTEILFERYTKTND